MAITKNTQTPAQLEAIAAEAFPGLILTGARELTEGMCNAAYRLTLSDGREVILKIAPAGGAGLLRNEIRMMRAEVAAMELVRSHGAARVAEVYRHDDSCRVCSSEYFLMEALPGQSLFALRDSLPKAQLAALHREIGQLSRRVSGIRGEAFGMLGDRSHRFARLYDFFRYLMGNVLSDASAKQVDTAVPAGTLLRALQQDAPCFDEVTTPSLIHWDMWEGNIFVQDGHVSGIIDWERAMWAEPFLDDRFRRHSRSEAFLEGFGQTGFTPAEARRILWYDVFLYLTMMTEPVYRQYPDDSQYRWTRPLMEQSWAALQSGTPNL